MAKLDWYQIIESEELAQGDILRKMPILRVPDGFDWADINPELIQKMKIYDADLIIMTQSCDLDQTNKINSVTFCAITQVKDHPDFGSDLTSKMRDRLENIRQGRYVRFHLLDQCQIPTHETDFWLVDFNSIQSLPVFATQKLASKQGKRLRLLSPYREHLSQAFARVFMRVGLPSDIPSFK